MLLGSLFMYLIWPLIILVAFVVSKWAIDKYETNFENKK